jgi:hypothetical protein
MQPFPPRKGYTMTDYLYDTRGNAVGFIKGRYIHSMRGAAIGQINGTHVHKLSGPYVGELHKDMVVNKHLGNYGNIGNPGNPGNPEALAIPETGGPLITAIPTYSKGCWINAESLPAHA